MQGQEIDTIDVNIQADSLIKAANVLRETGAVAAGLELLEQAATLQKSNGNWRSYVSTSLRQFDFSVDLLDANARLTLLNEIIDTGRKHLPQEDSVFVRPLWKKGELLLDIGADSAAHPILLEAVNIGEKTQAWENLAWAYMILSIANYYQSDFSEMDKNLERAGAIATNNIENPDDHWSFIQQLEPILFDATGDYIKSLKASNRNLENLSKKTLSNNFDSLAFANAHNNHGAICAEIGDDDKAIHHFRIALDLFKKLPGENQSKAIIEINNNISLSYQKKTDWIRANFYLEVSESLLTAKPLANNYPEWIQTHQLLASNYIDQAAYERALNILESILPFSKNYNFHEHLIQGSLGRAMIELKQPQKSVSHLNIALAKTKSKVGAKHPKTALILQLLGRAYEDQNKPKIALNYFQQAIASLTPEILDSINFSNPNLATVTALTQLLPALEFKAKILTQLSKEDQLLEILALNTYELAIATIDSIRVHHESEAAKLLLSKSAKNIYEGAIALLFDRHEKNNDPLLLAAAFKYAEKSKSNLLLETISASKVRSENQYARKFQSQLDVLLEKSKKINTEILFFESKLAQAQLAKLDAKHPRIQNAEAALASLYQEDLSWKEKIKDAFPSYYDLQYNQSYLSVTDVQQYLLKDNESLLEYFIGPSAAFLFVIGKQKTEWIKLKKPNQIYTLAQNFRTQLNDFKAPLRDAKKAMMDYNQTAHQLNQDILNEALKSLSADCKKIIIIPDGILNSIPFESITTSLMKKPGSDFGQQPYLQNDYTIHYGYSATLLRSNKMRHKLIEANDRCLAIAPTNSNQLALVENQTRSNDAVLAGAANEIQAIKNYFPGSYDLEQSPTETYFKSEAENYGILHLALHGVPDFENPNFAYLNFGNAPTDSLNDNRLYHFEVANMNFNSQLAVLSACETGLGKYEAGEGVFSLARGFMYAGVPSAVMSLWKIDDQSTSELIPIFYQQLAKGVPKNEALKFAKKVYLQIADLEHRHPYYWAGLVLMGEEQPLKRSRGYLWFWLAGLSLLVVILFLVRRK